MLCPFHRVQSTYKHRARGFFSHLLNAIRTVFPILRRLAAVVWTMEATSAGEVQRPKVTSDSRSGLLEKRKKQMVNIVI